MKTVISLITRLFKFQEKEIQEAPRFEEWYNQMNPRDTYIPNVDEVGRAILEFKNAQRLRHTQNNGHSQSF
jgi:hypothetical protein